MSPLTGRFDLPAHQTSPNAARHAVRSVLTAWGYYHREWTDLVMVVVSELVTNAIRHGGGCVGVDLQARETDVVVSVADGSSVLPRRRHPASGESNGRGILLIETLAASWGVTEHHGGKRVWARLTPYPR
jgi:anti-sigma regulatory factor (Ser/Thr protein kinase)